MDREELRELVLETCIEGGIVDQDICNNIADSVADAYEPPPKRQRFYRLPDGNCIAPEIVRGVFCLPAEYSRAGVMTRPDRVILLDDEGSEYVIPFTAWNDAIRYRDMIAEGIEAML